MEPIEIKVITKRTRRLIEAANYTLEYSNTIIEQSQKLILSMNQQHFIDTKDIRYRAAAQ